MKVRATNLYFDGAKRQRPGSVFEISNDRWKQGDKVPNGKKVGDLKGFSPSCMELVDDKTPTVSLKRDIITSDGQSSSNKEVI